MDYYHEFTPIFGAMDWVFFTLSVVAMVVVGFRQSQWQDGFPIWVTKRSTQHQQVKWVAIALAVLFGVILLIEHGDGLIQWFDNKAEKPDVSPASALLAAVILSAAFWVIMRLVAWVAGLAKHGWYWVQRARLIHKVKTISANVSSVQRHYNPRHAKHHYGDYYDDYYDSEMRKHRDYCQKTRRRQRAYKEASRQELKPSRKPKGQQCHPRKREDKQPVKPIDPKKEQSVSVKSGDSKSGKGWSFWPKW